MAETQTYTVTGTYEDRDGNVWVLLRGLFGAFLIDQAVEVDSSVTVVGRKAFAR